MQKQTEQRVASMADEHEANLDRLREGLRSLKRANPTAFAEFAALECPQEVAYGELQRRAGLALRLLHGDLVEMIAYDSVDVRRAVVDIVAE